MDIEFIIVQAGGKGTRLMPLTKNRPKALVPVENMPLLFHLFQKYPDKKYVIIGDYKFDALQRYLETYATVNYMLIRSVGEGNAAGIKSALSLIPEHAAFMLIWSDLLLSEDFDPMLLPTGNYIGVTNRYACSWRYESGKLEKVSVQRNGVAGCFLFRSKEVLSELPEQGSFTKYLQTLPVSYESVDMGQAREMGTLEALRTDSRENRCRPYNKMTFTDEQVTKVGLTKEAEVLIQREIEWYTKVDSLHFRGIPKIYSYSPLTLERIHGENIFKVQLDDSTKKIVIDKLYDRLDELHHLTVAAVNCHDMWEDYYAKTMRRLRSIRDVIPFANEKVITINDLACPNIYCYPGLLQDKVKRILQGGEFGIIHGDCTLTNTLLDTDNNIYFIDARGYFGHSRLVGDVYYDWAKIYYSIEGAFDRFNVGDFSLNIGEKSVEYAIAPSGWEHLTEYFLRKIPNCDVYRLKLIHAIIWLSLASHCSEDYDSLCTAFYNGLYLLNTLDGE